MTTQTAQVINMPATVEKSRDASAKRIRDLMVNWTQNTLDLGAELAKARETFSTDPKRTRDERPGFIKWCQQQFGLGGHHINSLIKVHEKFGGHRDAPRLSQKVLRILATDSVPDSARQEAIERSGRGERLRGTDAKEIADRHRLPSPKAANDQAKEEKRPVLASDGYIYFGTDPDKAKEGEDRRTMVYGVRRALETLGGIELTASQFLSYALPHQLWTKEEGKIIKQALRWLTSLDAAWDKRSED
jgi:hypothetical protein